MSKRRRSIDDNPQDTEKHGSVDRFVLRGLNNLCYNGSIETYNILAELNKELQPFSACSPKLNLSKPKETGGQIRKSPVFTNLQDIAQREQTRRDVDMVKLPRYKLNPMVVNGSSAMSMLQRRFHDFKAAGSPTGARSLTPDVRKYYLLLAMQEHEMENGPMSEDYSITMVGKSCWTPTEKRKFFMAVDRSSRGDVAEISRRLGPTKTVAEVAAYLNLLDGAAKAIGGYVRDDSYTAREMSDIFLIQEHTMAAVLEAKLETESYAKHQELMNSDVAQKAMDLFEIWNFSSLTRIYSEINDMTVLSSTLVQYYELLQRFIKDILTSVYAEMLNSSKTIVSRSMMNHVIAKRKYTWTGLNDEKDVRLKNLDIMAMIDRRTSFHKPFSNYRSASFLAKRRRMAWQNTSNIHKRSKSDGNIIEIGSDDSSQDEYEDAISEEGYGGEEDDSEEEEKDDDDENLEELEDSEDDDDEEEDSDDDDMLKPFDHEDELTGQYILLDLKKQHLLDDAHFESSETINTFQDQEDDQESDDEDYEESIEDKMKILDKTHEQELMQQLGFYDVSTILAHKDREE